MTTIEPLRRTRSQNRSKAATRPLLDRTAIGGEGSSATDVEGRHGLAGKNDIVGIAESPKDTFQFHHSSHPQPKLPQQQVLHEVPGQAPCPERELSIADRTKTEPAQFEDEKIGAEKIVAPIFEEPP
jgi:hypothetical protein